MTDQRSNRRGMRLTKSRFACPHCRSALMRRSSRCVDATYRQIVLICRNDECGATYGAEEVLTHIISPSAMPDPAVRMRQVPPRRRALPVPANDGHPARLDAPVVPPSANDDAAMIRESG